MNILKENYERMKEFAPMPWYLDYDTPSGICIKDSKGDIVFFEDYGAIGDEQPSYVHEHIVMRARTIAFFLLALSNSD